MAQMTSKLTILYIYKVLAEGVANGQYRRQTIMATVYDTVLFSTSPFDKLMQYARSKLIK